MKFSLLADEPSAAETVAAWYFDEWCRDTGRYTKNEVLAKVSTATNIDRAPLIVLVRMAGELVGAAELKIREMDMFPEYEFWLGGVYVAEKARGHGVASALVKEVLDRARAAGISTLYLQTESLCTGLYSHHGFMAIQEVNYKGIHVVVMKVELCE